MKQQIKGATKQHFESFSLSKQQLQQLDQLQKQSKSKRKLKWLVPLIPAVAGIIVLLVMFKTELPDAETLKMGETIAKQLAFIHNKQLNMEEEISSIEEAKIYLKKLDFSMVNSSVFPPQQWEMLGVRYCNIQNILAAELRIKHIPTNKYYTWYQLPDDTLANLSQEFETYSRGVKVNIWKEKGVIHGLAGPP